MIGILGSGPSAVAAALALIKRGLKPCIVDVGQEVPGPIRTVVEDLRLKTPEEWPANEVATLKRGMRSSAKGIPVKLSFGSDFPYRQFPGTPEFEIHGSTVRPSFALGGLSNVWGAALMPWRQEDVPDWPIQIADLKSHYEAVAKLTRLTGANDDLDVLFPGLSFQFEDVSWCSQARAFHADLTRARETLLARGIHFGRGRVAIRAATPGALDGCQYCGLCAYGCPYEAIYNSATTIRAWSKAGLVDYRPGLAARRFVEKGGQVFVECEDATGGRTDLCFERLFVACGVLPTAALVLESLEKFDTTVMARDSQYFLVPLLRAHGPRGMETERLHTLSQIFLELIDPKVCNRTVHLQTYTYNDLLPAALRNMTGPFAPFVTPMLGAVVSRLLILMGFLHSDQSQQLALTLTRTGTRRKLCVKAVPNKVTAQVIRRVVRKLYSQSRLLRAIPVGPMANAGKPGGSFHIGSTFPMSTTPGSGETDLLGRLNGFEKVHLVDASILPSLAATTITFTAMANAHRIASEAAEF